MKQANFIKYDSNVKVIYPELSHKDVLLYCYIRWIIETNSWRCFFQISETIAFQLNLSEKTIDSKIFKLKELWLIETDSKYKYDISKKKRNIYLPWEMPKITNSIVDDFFEEHNNWKVIDNKQSRALLWFLFKNNDKEEIRRVIREYIWNLDSVKGIRDLFNHYINL